MRASNPVMPLRMPIHRLQLLALVLALISAFAATRTQAQAPSERRVALVIGNAAYKVSPLKNPVNDAQAVSTSLKDLGFEVTLRENTTLRELIESMRQFAVRAQEAHVRLVFYAGHSLQAKGRNYLLPVDTEVQTEDDLPAKSGDVSQLVERLGQHKQGINIVILDACRNNPFSGGTVALPDGRRLTWRGAAPAGLARMDAPIGTFIAFSTAPGNIALDNPNGKHSFYTKHLLANMQSPGMPIEQMFKAVRVGVAQDTSRAQVPWESSSLIGDFCFRRAGTNGCK